MKITEEWLKEKLACVEGVNWFKTCKVSDGLDVVRALMDDKKYLWANWLILHLMDHPQKIRYAICAATQVLDIFEKKFPEDKRPRQAIEAAETYLRNPSVENRVATYVVALAVADAADAAAYDAPVATYAALAVADAAHVATYAALAVADAADADAYAAHVAAYAALAVANAADAAAFDAAHAADAAKKEMQIKILNCGIGIFGRGKDRRTIPCQRS